MFVRLFVFDAVSLYQSVSSSVPPHILQFLHVKPRCNHWAAGRLVGRSVRRGHHVEKVRKRAFSPLPIRPRLVLAVYPALLNQWTMSSSLV